MDPLRVDLLLARIAVVLAMNDLPPHSPATVTGWARTEDGGFAVWTRYAVPVTCELCAAGRHRACVRPCVCRHVAGG